MPISDLERLTTEQPNPASTALHERSVREILAIINDADKEVPLAVERVIDDVAAAVARILPGMKEGGRLFYIGAGTSGRLGVVDAAECPPTFGVPPELVRGIIAGGPEAVFRSIEGAEDDPGAGAAALDVHQFTALDSVVGLSASGRTPYVLGALRRAREIGAAAIGVCCNPHSELAAVAEITIAPIVGPEVITGSTRMKAGTAEKLVLNMISTTLMVQLGRVSGNLMVDLQTKCDKLRDRAARIVATLSDVPRTVAQEALARADGDIRRAVESLGGQLP